MNNLSRLASLAALLAITVSVRAQDNPAPDSAAPAPEATTAPADAAPAAAETAPAPTDAAAPAAEAAAPAPAPETVPTIAVDAPKDAAPKKDATHLDTVEVTGSRLKRTDYETAQPVVSISREDIEKTGLTDVSQILRHLSVAGNNSLTMSQGRLSQSLGETNLDLRNLGATHTLLLVNGRRWVTGLIPTQPSVSDYNTIPTAIIERIEILKDGASAIYGSDAIGGVVNIITRKDYQGLGLDYQMGEYIKERDGMDGLASVSWGTSQPGQSLFVNLNYNETRRALTANRPLTATSTPGTGTTRWSKTTDRGRFEFIDNGSSQTASFYQCPNLQTGIASGAAGVDDPTVGATNGTPAQGAASNGVGAAVPAGLVLCDLALKPGAAGGSLADYRQNNPDEDVYNKFLDGSLKEPNKRAALFATYTLDFADHLNLTVDGLYNMRRSTTIGQNLPLLGGNLGGGKGWLSGIYATNAFNPFQHNIGVDASCGGTPGGPTCTGLGSGSGAWLIRLRPGRNNWLFEDDVDTARLASNLKGDFSFLDTAMFWDGGYIYAQNKIKDTSPLFRFDNEARALGNDPNTGLPSSLATVCTGDCVPLDVFHGQAGLTDAMLDYLFHDTYQKNRSSQHIGYADVSFELPLAFLTAPMAVAIGLEARRDAYKSEIDPVVQQGLTILNTQKDYSGSSLAKEVYTELGIPLLKDLPFVHVLDLDVAGRYSMYKSFGNVFTGKGGLRWQPHPDLLMRTTYSTGFRAPNIAELGLPESQSYDPLTDPCADPTAATACTPQEQAGAQNNGTVTQPYDIWKGNPDLKPEKSKNLTYGLVYSPHQIQDLNFNLDFYKITVDQFITIGTGQYFMDQCYIATPHTSPYCDNIHRDAAQTLQFIDTPFINLGGINTSGFDMGVDFRVPLGDELGDLKVELDASYLSAYDFIQPTGEKVGAVGTDTGLFNGWPRWKAGSELAWKTGPWTTVWSTRMAYKMTEPCTDVYEPSYADLGKCSDIKYDKDGTDISTNTMKTVFYHNLQVGRDLPQWNTDVTLGVNNVLNQEPPISYSMIGFYWYNYDPNQQEIPGRFGYLKLNYKF